MEFFETIRRRQSIRSYENTPVPPESIAKIREAVVLAPTACNKQPFKVFFIKDPAMRAELNKACSWCAWLGEAPAVAVVTGNSDVCWKRWEGDPIADVDCAIVMENLILAAAAEGLGTCWICAYDRKAVDKVLGLGPEWHSVAMTPVGFAKNVTPRPPRKNPDDVFEVK